jgi:hypothetical protein
LIFEFILFILIINLIFKDLVMFNFSNKYFLLFFKVFVLLIFTNIYNSSENIEKKEEYVECIANCESKKNIDVKDFIDNFLQDFSIKCSRFIEQCLKYSYNCCVCKKCNEKRNILAKSLISSENIACIYDTLTNKSDCFIACEVEENLKNINKENFIIIYKTHLAMEYLNYAITGAKYKYKVFIGASLQVIFSQILEYISFFKFDLIKKIGNKGYAQFEKFLNKYIQLKRGSFSYLILLNDMNNIKDVFKNFFKDNSDSDFSILKINSYTNQLKNVFG